MFDNTQIVKTKELAEAVKAISGAFLNEQQLTKTRVTDAQGNVLFVCPGMITRIGPATLYNPQRPGSEVFYVNGERFSIDLTTEQLGRQLGFGTEES